MSSEYVDSRWPLGFSFDQIPICTTFHYIPRIMYRHPALYCHTRPSVSPEYATNPELPLLRWV